MDTRVELGNRAYIAGDTMQGVVIIKASKPVSMDSMDLKLVGDGFAQFFNAKLRTVKLCNIVHPTIQVKDYCIDESRLWHVEFTLQLEDSLPSTIDGKKKGCTKYFLIWTLHGTDLPITTSKHEVIILSKRDFSAIEKREINGDNHENEEYDQMKLRIFSPTSAYLPSEKIQFRAYIHNLQKKSIKKVAVLLLQNVVFFKSDAGKTERGRCKSSLMNAKEKIVSVKQDCSEEWSDEIQIPDPVPPSACAFHKVSYELVLVAITKGKKSDIRTVFEEARYHFDLEKFQDDYFRDFLPHTACHLEIASNDEGSRSPSMTGGPAIPTLEEQWQKLVEANEKKKRKIVQAKLIEANPECNVSSVTS